VSFDQWSDCELERERDELGWTDGVVAGSSVGWSDFIDGWPLGALLGLSLGVVVGLSLVLG
jgi:hypothetical protein